MKEHGFVIRCYEKSELALLYFPGLGENAAVDKLRRWIRRCECFLGICLGEMDAVVFKRDAVVFEKDAVVFERDAVVLGMDAVVFSLEWDLMSIDRLIIAKVE